MALDLSALDDDFRAEMGAGASGTVARAPLHMFEEDPRNPRFEQNTEAFDALVADVRERGILQPVVVRRAVDGKLRIRFGARRYRAAVHLALVDVPYVVTEDERQFDDYAQVSENERRAPLQPLEMATFVARKLSEGEKKKTVAARLRMDPSALTHLLALVGDVPPFVLELYHSHKCRTPQYLYELRRLCKGHEHLVAQRCAKAADIDRRLIVALAEETSLVSSARARENGGKRSQVHAEIGTSGVRDRADECNSIPTAAPIPAVLSSPLRTSNGNEVPTWPHMLRPQLLGAVYGQAVRVDFSLRPSSPDLVVVHSEQGGSREVPLGEIRLTRLSESDE